MIKRAQPSDVLQIYQIMRKYSLTPRKIKSASYLKQKENSGFFYTLPDRTSLFNKLTHHPFCYTYNKSSILSGFIVTSILSPVPPQRTQIKVRWFRPENKKVMTKQQTLSVDYIGVDPAYRKKGTGTALLSHVETVAKKHNFRYLVTWVVIQPLINKPSLNFFSKNGYIRIAESTIVKTSPEQTSALLYKSI